MYRIQRQAEDAVRGGAVHLILTDRNISPERAAIPSILAVGGVHSHLVAQSLRTFTSLNVESAECMDVHYFAVLVGRRRDDGQTPISPTTTIADRHRRGLFGDRALEDCLRRYQEAVNQGLLKVMSKMGISILSSYRGGYKFEAVG